MLKVLDLGELRSEVKDVVRKSLNTVNEGDAPCCNSETLPYFTLPYAAEAVRKCRKWMSDEELDDARHFLRRVKARLGN